MTESESTSNPLSVESIRKIVGAVINSANPDARPAPLQPVIGAAPLVSVVGTQQKKRETDGELFGLKRQSGSGKAKQRRPCKNTEPYTQQTYRLLQRLHICVRL